MNPSIQSLIVIVSIVVAIWLTIGSVYFLKIQKQLQSITKGISKKDLKTILSGITQDQADLKTKLKELSDIQAGNAQQGRSHFQKMGFVRFNPFSDTGGDQSFSLCLLDGHNDGIVITSLHSRDSTRIYTKQIKAGKADGRQLSKEEQQAYKSAQKP